MADRTILRPDPVPICCESDPDSEAACPKFAVGAGCNGPACEAHRCSSRCSAWRYYRDDEPPSPPKPIAIGVVAEARRLLELIGDAQSNDAQAELLALALDRAHHDARAEALLAAHRVWSETMARVGAAAVAMAREGK